MLEFRKLREFPILRVLEDWWCCGCSRLKIGLSKESFVILTICKHFST
ncbi:hypothetical protein MtrunA17_Chr4g0019031 [Medicago truncatula]|uniref:Uncharacterized protein n=1 Tax=Medicago truncatula TaxID=3880 RepID=A0A396I553_MEDTR|nr:hypothetical protein MtrunA17_Chr4g0019031 [Medicago truncatula]